MKTQISVIGCGWLGLPLAKTLVKEGFNVNGSTTSKDKIDILKHFQIKPFTITLSTSGISGNYSQFLTGSKTVIINIPPGLRKNPTKNHVAELTHLIDAIEKHDITNVLYISSTSVYKDEAHFPVKTAKSIPNATSNTAKQIIAIENLLRENANFNTTILRFGGLIGEDRHPSKFLSGRDHIPNPEAPINLIHKTDCIAICIAILKKELWNVSLNAVYPKHPSKKVYYSKYCKKENLELPKYDYSKESKGKIIDSTTLVQLLNYTFKAEH